MSSCYLFLLFLNSVKYFICLDYIFRGKLYDFLKLPETDTSASPKQ